MNRGIDIWVQVTCGKCGCMACNSGWYYSGIVSRLKNECKDWKKDDIYGTVCPSCYNELHAERTCENCSVLNKGCNESCAGCEDDPEHKNFQSIYK